MFSKFFIDRPIFANVIAIVTMLARASSRCCGCRSRSIPTITPPTVQVTASYPGANAQVVADTVAAPIEQQVNGVENMLYMSSSARQRRRLHADRHLRGRHRPGHAPRCWCRTASRSRRPQLPPRGRSGRASPVKKKSPNILLVVNLISPDGTLRQPLPEQLRHDPAPRRARARRRASATSPSSAAATTACGSGSTRRSCRAARPDRRRTWSSAIQQQNVQVAAGQIGQPPRPPGQAFQYTDQRAGPARPSRSSSTTSSSRRDRRRRRPASSAAAATSARVELGRPDLQTSSATSTASPRRASPSSSCPAPTRWTSPSAVAADDGASSAQRFPEGVDYAIPFDTTPFVDESIHEVFKTLLEAGVLVLVVILVFLQDWRAALIPVIDGAGHASSAPSRRWRRLGFTVNMLTLFGLVLAIGIVVDDAIVVVENVEHHIEQRHAAQGGHDQGDGRGDRARSSASRWC